MRNRADKAEVTYTSKAKLNPGNPVSLQQI